MISLILFYICFFPIVYVFYTYDYIGKYKVLINDVDNDVDDVDDVDEKKDDEENVKISLSNKEKTT